MTTGSVALLLLAIIALLGLAFAARWVVRMTTEAARGDGDAGPALRPTPLHLGIGAVTNFFDTLGIGSFATTTTLFRMLRLVPDEQIPGTMIVGHALAVVAQALIFIAIVQVESTTLVSMVAISLVGGWLGAGIVSRLPRRAIQVGMGTALLIAAIFMVVGQVGWLPGGGTALGLPTGKLVVASAVNFVLGALLMLGIGNYGPCLVLLSLLGMDPRAAFPIMMSTGALVATVGGMRFLASGRFHPQAALGLAVGGVPAVLVAGLVVKSLPLGLLRWLVVGVVVYAAAMLLRGAAVERTGA